MDLGLKDRVYVVTGASRGLGLAGAQALVADGARVVVCARDEQRLAEVAESLGGNDHALAVRVTSPRAGRRPAWSPPRWAGGAASTAR